MGRALVFRKPHEAERQRQDVEEEAPRPTQAEEALVAWAKLDDRFHSHPKVERAGLAATGLYAMALSYAACHETDGEIPDVWVRKQAGLRHASKLVELGLWERSDGGYLICDFLDFNPSKAEVQARRRAKQEAGRAGGRASGRGRSKREAGA